MPLMRSIRPHTYDGKDRPPDSVYMVADEFVPTVLALGMAMLVPDPPKTDDAPKSKRTK